MKNTLKSVSFFVLLLVLFGFVSCKAESGDDASIPVTTQEKPTNQPQPSPQPQAGTYIVQHYQQDTTGDGYTLFETERLTGTAGEQTKAAAKTYEHFSAKTFSQAAIKADGSTVIRIDYDREIITLIFDKADESANWNDEWSGQAQDGKITIKGRYGANVAAPTIPKKTGYGTSWDKEVQTTFASNETYTAQYTEGQVNYTVEHWLENLENDEYTKQFTEDDKTGTTGSQTAAEPKSEYAEQGYEIPTVTQATISADGSTVVQIRYARKRYTVSFDTNGAGTVTSQTVKHGGKVGEPAALTKTGYNFKGWFVSTDGGTTLAGTAFDFANTTITDDVALYAKWEIKTFTVTFDSKGGGEVASQTVEYGKKATSPNPEKVPYDLLGWFISTDGGATLADTAFDFNTEITTDVALFAKWEIRANADNVASKIGAMAESDVVVVTGEITDSTLSAIKDAIGRKRFGIGIDLSGTSGVTSIGEWAFRECSGLTSIELPSGVTSIGEYAFSSCSGLTSINVSVDNIEYTSIDGVLYSKDKTRIVAYPSGKSATSYEILESVTSIGEEAFEGCSGLTSIRLPSGLTSIGDSAFKGCSSLMSINLPSGVTSIGEYAFTNCSSLTSIELPSGLTSIGESAFFGCRGLTSISLPSGLTSIGDYAFYWCSGLTSINLPSGVTSIGDYAFSDCSGLTSIELPSGVTSIGRYAFNYCRSLTSITFAGTVEQWNAITKSNSWRSGVPATKVVCSDGEVSL